MSLLPLGCGDPEGSRGDPTADLSPEERERLDTFIGEIRRAYEAGNAGAVEALIQADGTPEFMLQATRRRSLPKGPMKVVDLRVEPRPPGAQQIITLNDVAYEFNVEPLGVLVIEIDDVSIGNTKAELVIGRRDGAFYIAGLRPLE